jgi:hypothetical protein
LVKPIGILFDFNNAAPGGGRLIHQLRVETAAEIKPFPDGLCLNIMSWTVAKK